MPSDTTSTFQPEDRQHYRSLSPRSVLTQASSRTLRSIEILRNVDSSTLTELDRRCRWLDLREGDVLAGAGEHLNRVFLLLTGEVRFSFHTRVGKTVSLPPASAGTVIDATGLAGLPLPYSIEAGGYCTVASISARTVMELAARDRGLMQVLTTTLIERQHLLVRNIVELSTMSVRARIHNELLRLSRDRQASDGSGAIHPVPTHAELANRVGTHREAVSRELSHLQHLGILHRRGDTILIPNISRLAELHADMQD